MRQNPFRILLPIICLSILGLRLVPTVRAGAWLTNSPMATARIDHTATLLQNGKVLVAGGNDGTNTLATAELYDPATGLWTPTSPLHTPRFYHTATLLQNGKVLVAGGLNPDSLSSAELYDPASGTWTLTGPLNVARTYCRATLLPDGEVLLTGGTDTSTSTNTPTAELYNPATGAWTLTENMNEARASHTATLLPDGRVLVAGGSGNLMDFSDPDSTLSSIEIYDPSLGTWTPGGSLIQKRSWHTATLLPNGLVMFAGGIDFDGTPTSPYLSAVELYDPIAGTNALAAAMSTARADHTATLSPNGTVLVTGGQIDSNGDLTNSVEVYDPATDTWSITNSLAAARFLQTATLLPSGEILVTGGATTNDTVTPTTELYDSTIGPAAGAWKFTGSMQFRRRSFTMTLLPDGTVLAASGENGNGTPYSSAELYDATTGTWTNTGSLNNARFHHAATLLPNGKVLVTGGITTAFQTTSAELYDPAIGIWTTINPMNSPHYAHTATLLRNGKVLVAGDGFGHPNSAELYDSSTGTWTATGNMITSRTYHKAILLPNGKVLVVGGDHNTTYLSSAELYDPATGKWTAAGATRAFQELNTASVLLPNGRVLVAGGDTNNLPVADLFDPATGSWTAAQPPKAVHFLPTFTLLSNGKALLVSFGGSPEIFDPATGQWTTTGNLNQDRYDQQSVELPDGRVLTAGGDIGPTATTNAELFDIGLAFTDSSRPQIVSAPSTLNLADTLTLTGSGFRGISEGSSDSTQESSTDYPLVQLKSLENSQTTFLLTTNWSTTSFTSLPVWNFPPGYALATVFVNGIPSTSSIVNIAVPLPALTALRNLQTLPNGSFQFTFTNNPGAMFGVLASTNLTLPSSNWTALSGVTEIAPGQFQFNDPQATNSPQRFYRLFAP